KPGLLLKLIQLCSLLDQATPICSYLLQKHGQSPWFQISAARQSKTKPHEIDTLRLTSDKYPCHAKERNRPR
ncbi:MAG TPA: hypothetical protein DCX09_04955, partial [Gammaproteobacteria bacterium]|nr:hypothetical protein [Gammaproteobacteria bacterium]